MGIKGHIDFGLTKSVAVLFLALQISGCGGDSPRSTTATVTVKWVAPLERSDTTTLNLSDIGGYRVYYGTTTGDYPNRLDINDGTTVEATVTVPHGTYFYVITAYDVKGRESVFSAETEITI